MKPIYILSVKKISQNTSNHDNNLVSLYCYLIKYFDDGLVWILSMILLCQLFESMFNFNY